MVLRYPIFLVLLFLFLIVLLLFMIKRDIKKNKFEQKKKENAYTSIKPRKKKTFL